MGSPSVILADKPTAALDSENGIAVMSLLSQIAKDRSRAVLAVTHDPHRAIRILRIEDGLIVGEERRAEGVETVHELARTRKRKAIPGQLFLDMLIVAAVAALDMGLRAADAEPQAGRRRRHGHGHGSRSAKVAVARRARSISSTRRVRQAGGRVASRR